MSDLKLYRVSDAPAVQLTSSASTLERHLQKHIEANMDAFFGVRLLASEFSTGPVHGGRMDSIGLDEDGTPVILEYKRNVGETVINQGLYYLDWLLDHQGDFKVLVMEKLGAEVAATIEFSNPRLICVANDFTKYDEHAIRQMGRAIELVRYQYFDGDLLALELFATTTAGTSAAKPQTTAAGKPKSTAGASKYTTVLESIERAPGSVRELYHQLRVAVEALGDDITVKVTKYYINFRRLKSFASVEVYPQARKVQVFVKLDPSTVELEEGFSRDVTNVGHLGNGNLELTVTDGTTLAKALPLIQRSYEAN